MKYYFEKTLNCSFDEALERVTDELQKEGFGVLTEIDVQSTLKKKLDVNFRNYRILGACNPTFAYKALLTEINIGTMLPCNVVVQQHLDGQIKITAIDPIASMQAIQNENLTSIAKEIRLKLERIIKVV